MVRCVFMTTMHLNSFLFKSLWYFIGLFCIFFYVLISLYLFWILTELFFLSCPLLFSAFLSHSIIWAGYTVFLFPMAPAPPLVLRLQFPASLGVFLSGCAAFFHVLFFSPCFGSFHPPNGSSFHLLFCVPVGNSLSTLAAGLVLASQKSRILRSDFRWKIH